MLSAFDELNRLLIEKLMNDCFLLTHLANYNYKMTDDLRNCFSTGVPMDYDVFGQRYYDYNCPRTIDAQIMQAGRSQFLKKDTRAKEAVRKIATPKEETKISEGYSGKSSVTKKRDKKGFNNKVTEGWIKVQRDYEWASMPGNGKLSYKECTTPAAKLAHIKSSSNYKKITDEKSKAFDVYRFPNGLVYRLYPLKA